MESRYRPAYTGLHIHEDQSKSRFEKSATFSVLRLALYTRARSNSQRIKTDQSESRSGTLLVV